MHKQVHVNVFANCLQEELYAEHVARKFFR